MIDLKFVMCGALAATGIARGAFVLDAVDLGGCPAACNGAPIFTTGSGFYQDDAGNNYPPSALFISIFPTLADDSYAAMDAVGASTASYTASAPGASPSGASATDGFFDAATPQAFSAPYFTAGGVSSGTSPSGQSGVMIAQLTTDGDLFGTGNHISIAGKGWLIVDLDGPASQGFALRSIRTRTAQNGWNVFEVWVVEVPSPGGAALLPIAILAWGRRRCGPPPLDANQPADATDRRVISIDD